MDFFEAQDRAKRRTGLLVLLFASAVAGIILAVYLVATVTLGTIDGASSGFDPALFAVVAVGTGTLVGLGSLFRTAQLRSGGPAVASLLGGRAVDPGTTDSNERRLVNVVEEMALASGMPVPAIFVLPGEQGINAFAAGYTIHDAAVAVTQGALERLSREELEGVIAHEFSHILNGDMRLNIRLIGLLFGILLLAIVGRGILRGGMYGRIGRGGGRRGGGGGQIALLGLALIAVGYIGVLFGKVIKAAVSRQREFLADAAAVQFTRNPRGLAGALARIHEDMHGATIADHHAEELSHLFFANGMTGALSSLMATHPPLEQRIRRIDSSWEELSAADPSLSTREPTPGTAREPEAETRQTAAPGGAGKARADAPLDARVAAGLLLASIGNPTAGHVERARRIMDRIPPRLREAAHDPLGARAVILGMLGGDSPERSAARRDAVARIVSGAGDETDGSTRESAEALARSAEELDPDLRLPLVDLTLPALHLLDPSDARTFRQEVRSLAGGDGSLETFDFALIHILWRHLPDGPPRRGAGEGRKALSRLVRELETVLSALAHFGHDDEESAERAFREGAAKLDDAGAGLVGAGGSRAEARLQPRGALDLGRVDAALARLERGSLQARKRILESMIAVALADGEVRTAEVELLRAVAESLELPLPPLLPGGTD